MKDIVEEVNYDGIEDVKHMFGSEKAGPMGGALGNRGWGSREDMA